MAWPTQNHPCPPVGGSCSSASAVKCSSSIGRGRAHALRQSPSGWALRGERATHWGWAANRSSDGEDGGTGGVVSGSGCFRAWGARDPSVPPLPSILPSMCDRSITDPLPIGNGPRDRSVTVLRDRSVTAPVIDRSRGSPAEAAIHGLLTAFPFPASGRCLQRIFPPRLILQREVVNERSER